MRTLNESRRPERQPGYQLKLAWYEDALALASYFDSLGFVEDAEAMRGYAAKIRPAGMRSEVLRLASA